MTEQLDFDEIQTRLAEKARFDAFDTLIDMALDGVITMEEAQVEWEERETAD